MGCKTKTILWEVQVQDTQGEEVNAVYYFKLLLVNIVWNFYVFYNIIWPNNKLFPFHCGRYILSYCWPKYCTISFHAQPYSKGHIYSLQMSASVYLSDRPLLPVKTLFLHLGPCTNDLDTSGPHPQALWSAGPRNLEWSQSTSWGLRWSLLCHRAYWIVRCPCTCQSFVAPRKQRRMKNNLNKQ